MTKKEMFLKGAAIILIGGSAIREITKIVKSRNEQNEDVVETEKLGNDYEQ